MRDYDLERLLQAAAKTEEPPMVGVPFGFDTRVVALWRAARGERAGAVGELARLARRIVVTALVVTVFSGIGAYWEVAQNEEAAEPSNNAYAIADTAIETGVFQ